MRLSGGQHTAAEAAALETIAIGLILANPIDPGPHLFTPQDEIAGGALIFLGATAYSMLQLFPTEGRFHEYSHLGGVPYIDGGQDTSTSGRGGMPGVTSSPGSRSGSVATFVGTGFEAGGFAAAEGSTGFGFGFLAADLEEMIEDAIPYLG